MRFLKNIGGLSENSLEQLARLLESPPEDSCARNIPKGQYIYLREMEGKRLVVKVFLHMTWQHRLAAWIHQANADRYERACTALAKLGTPVPRPVLILKTGPRLLPERTLYVMGRVEGRMLLELLPEIAGDEKRTAVLAPRIARLFLDLKAARLVHRDLNTKNILISADNQVALIDFDFTRRHLGGQSSYLKKHRRDLKTFASTCGPATALASAVLALADPDSIALS